MKEIIENGTLVIQNISGTIFEHLILEYKYEFQQSHYYLVENVESGFKHVLNDANFQIK